ncbi:MAG TPA: TonB-dependent receptor plug domain-containing protein, partial [Pseudomonadaceae bacterium]|nr:TonB-dependent receptor plug domain-containing protein [Pseudomonadaceae bacterium]
MSITHNTSRGARGGNPCRTFRRSTLSKLSVVIAGLTACSVMAQDVVEEVSVTGSRIRDTGMTSPTPVTSISRDEMDNLSPGTLMDSLDLLPQFLNSSTIEDTGSPTTGTWSGVGAQSTLNMRGVGGNRTLVLLNGRRIVPSNRLSTVDINLFPQALIQRTEAVTGGASAAYGSDAIAGVTNFILDTGFEGFSANLQGGVTDYGDGENARASIAAGRSLNERSHFILGADYYRSASIDNFDGRDWYRPWGSINHGATGGVPNQLPQREQYDNVYSRNSTFGGLIPSGPLAGTHF